MPNQDGTGPMGAGPLTGGGRGPCGLGLAQGRGLGRFWGRRFWRAPVTNQTQDLTDYIKSLEEELEEAKKQLSDQK